MVNAHKPRGGQRGLRQGLWSLAVPLLVFSGGFTACSAKVEAPEGRPVPCRIGQNTAAVTCRLVTLGTDWIVFRPDGGFRRFAWTDTGLATADGAEVAQVKPLARGTIAVVVGDDLYQLPDQP